MHIPGFEIEFPDHIAKVAESYTDQTSDLAVVCIPTVASGGNLGNESDELSKRFDEHIGKLLDAFLRNGVKVICVDSMQAQQGRADALGPLVHETFKKYSVTPFGVDNLELEQKMREVGVFVASSNFHQLLTNLDQNIFKAIHEHGSSVFREFFTLQQSYEQRSSNIYDASSQLYELSQGLNIPVPSEILRALIVLARSSEMDERAVSEEQVELLERFKHNASVAVFDSEMMTTFRTMALGASADDELNKLFHLDTSSVRLKGYEIHALNYARDLLGLDGLTATRVTPDVMVWQSIKQARLRRYAGNADSMEQLRFAENAERMYNVAHILGVDMHDYPHFCKYAERTQILLSFGGRDYFARLMQTFNQIWTFFEKHIPQTPLDNELMAILTRFRLLRKLSLLQLVPDEYDFAIENLETFSLNHVAKTLSTFGIEIEPAMLRSIDAFDDKRDFMLSFYDNARQRASSMALGTLKRMNDVGSKRAVLICLGFHMPTVKSIWAGQSISYSIVFPDPSS